MSVASSATGGRTRCWSYFSISYEDPSVFARSQWQNDDRNKLWYLIVRWFIGLYFLLTWFVSILQVEVERMPFHQHMKWGIYLTNWSYTICTVQAVFATIMVTSAYIAERKTGIPYSTKTVLILYQAYWVLNIIATDIALPISIVYWALIFESYKLTVNTVIVHTFNTVFMFFDLCILAHPVKVLHFYWTVIYLSLYGIFNVTFYYAGGTTTTGRRPIYTILDWEYPGRCIITILGMALFATTVHFLVFGIFCLRRFLWRRRYHREDLSYTSSRL